MQTKLSNCLIHSTTFLDENILVEIKNKTSTTIEDMLKKVLQMDKNYIKNEIKAERIGALN